MRNVLQFPPPPITEDDLRIAHSMQQMSWRAQTAARLTIASLIERVKAGAAVPSHSDYDFVPELGMVFYRPGRAADVSTGQA